MVFCIVERLPEYEDQDRGDDAQALIEGLIRICRQIRGRKKGCLFKLLVTGNRECMLSAAHELEDEGRINVPEKVDSRGGVSALQWDVTVGQDIENISGRSI